MKKNYFRTITEACEEVFTGIVCRFEGLKSPFCRQPRYMAIHLFYSLSPSIPEIWDKHKNKYKESYFIHV